MNEYFAQTLAGVLEETSTNMGNAMVLDHLSKNGVVSIEEASFYHDLCTDVITEAAEDFIPETVEVPEPMEDIELFDAVGNKYVYSNGQLIPVDGEEEGMDEGMEEPADDQIMPEGMQESEVMYEEVLEEGEVFTGYEEEVPAVEESQILEESDHVVARILSQLK